MTTNTTYILIDYENIQPTDLRLPGDGLIKVKLFLGANQTKIAVALATSMHALGENAEYIQLESSGANALDFHIAYYIGHLSTSEPAASFMIVTRDTGFDPLILHLKSKGISVERSVSLLGSVQQADDDDFVQVVIRHFTRKNASRPRSKKTFMNSLRSLFKKDRTNIQILSLFDTLCSRGIVKLEDGRVVYDFPSESETDPDPDPDFDPDFEFSSEFWSDERSVPF